MHKSKLTSTSHCSSFREVYNFCRLVSRLIGRPIGRLIVGVLSSGLAFNVLSSGLTFNVLLLSQRRMEKAGESQNAGESGRKLEKAGEGRRKPEKA